MKKEYCVKEKITLIDIYNRRPPRINKYRLECEKHFENIFERLLITFEKYNIKNINNGNIKSTLELNINAIEFLKENNLIIQKDIKLLHGMRLKTKQSKYILIGSLTHKKELVHLKTGVVLDIKVPGTLNQLNEQQLQFEIDGD